MDGKNRSFSKDKIMTFATVVLVASGIVFPLYYSYSASLDDFTIEKLKNERSIQSEIINNTPTDPAIVMSQVHQFCMHIQQKGSLAFTLYKKNELESIDMKTQLSVHTLKQAKVVIDAAYPEIEGEKILFNLDAIGRFYIAEMNKMVIEQACGWIEYYIRPKDSDKSIITTSYACQCISEESNDIYVISASIPNVSKRQILNQLQESRYEK